MSEQYIIGIDQSTQGTKALLFREDGALIGRTDLKHEQIINEYGWVSHDPEEIYRNLIEAVRSLIMKTGVAQAAIAGIGISNQRETSVAWNRKTGKPVENAIVWQCARAKELCAQIEASWVGDAIRKKTGIPISPYFPAAKYAWVLEHNPTARELMKQGELCLGTVDSYLIFRLTGGERFQTDYSNASRTQLFNLHTLSWDEEICGWYGIHSECLPKVTDSDGDYGETDFEQLFRHKIPIHGVLGDSHGALFGQGCHQTGMIKSTYGTGSSIMMNIGEQPVVSEHGIVTSLAWGVQGKVNYVLEGNINYTGAVMTWLQSDLQMITSAAETEQLAYEANQNDTTYLVPAFSGLGAPYWDNEAMAGISGMTRTTGKKEIVKAALECIAYQITDILKAMSQDAGIQIAELRVDGGPTGNQYLMQFQSDIAGIPVQVPDTEELSGIGAAYMAGIALGIFDRDVLFSQMKRRKYIPSMSDELRNRKYAGWKKAVGKVLTQIRN